MWFRALAKLFPSRSCKRRPFRHQPTKSTRLLLEALEDRAVPSATVLTDKPDYAPGATVNITATGFKAGESVGFSVYDITDAATLSSWRVRDGGAGDLDHLVNGQIKTSWVVSASALNDSLRLNATGLTSGYTAQTFFTDSKPQFSFDFIAAAPTTYDHTTGIGGQYDARMIGTNVVESLEGGSFACGDVVEFFAAITVDSGVVGTQTLDFGVAFNAFSTGQEGVAYTQIVGVAVNSPDTGNMGDNGSVATLTSTSVTGPLFTQGSQVLGTIHVTDLEAGEVVIVRIDVLLGCNANAANATGNVQASLDVPGGGQQTIPLKNVENVAVPPVMANNDSFNCKTLAGLINSNQPFSFQTSLLLANDVGTGLTVTSVTSPTSLGGTVVLSGTTITYTPPATFGPHAIDTFTYTTSDGKTTSTATVSFTLNHPPITQPDTFNTAFNTPVSGNVLTNDSDPDGDALTVVNAGTFTSASGTLVLSSNGNFTFTPAAGFTGTFTFNYTVTDDCGAQSTCVLTINVNQQVKANDDQFDCKTLAGLINSNQAFSFATSLILANDVGTGITVTSVTSPTSLGGTVVLNGTTITYTPPATFGPHAVDSFSYTISDGKTTSTAKVFLTLNHPPVANPDTISTAFNTPVSGNVLTNDTDADGDVLHVTNPGTFTSASGTLVLSSNGAFTFTPAAGFSGKFTFSYTIADDCGATSNAALLTINVSPKANNDSFDCHTLVGLVDSTKPVSIATSLLLANDQGTGITVTSVSATSSLGGKVTLSGTTITYTAPATFGAHAVDTFTYTITDSSGGTATATVSLTLNHPPKANADAFVTVQGTAVSGNVLTNDTDADGGTLTVKNPGTFTSASGTLVLNSNGTFTFTPASTFTGQFTFTYTIVDDCGATSSATLTITVNPLSKNPFLAR